MNVNEFLLVGGDKFIRLNARGGEALGINPLYKVEASSRDSHFNIPYVHGCAVQFQAMKGRFDFKIAGQDCRLMEGGCLAIDPQTPYSFRSMERTCAVLHVQGAEGTVEDSWEETAQLLRK